MTTNLYHRQNNKTTKQKHKNTKTQKNGNGLTMNRELFIIGTFYYYYFFIIIITIRTLFFGNNNQVVYWTFIIEAFIILEIFLLQSPGRLGFKSFYIYISFLSLR